MRRAAWSGALGVTGMQIITMINTYAPRYVADLFTAVFGLCDLITRVSKRKSLEESAHFLLSSTFLYGFGSALLLGSGKIAAVVATTAAMALSTFLLMIASMQLNWKLFGGKMGWVEFFCVYAYVAGVTIMFWIPFAFVLPMAGTYFLLEQAPEIRPLLLWIVFLTAQFLMGCWTSPAREWFRHRQALSRWRSRCAQTLFVVIGVPIVLLTNYVVYYGAVRIAGLVD
jgi:hypothetical protein